MKPESLFILNAGVGIGGIKSRIARFESSKRWEISYTTIQIVPL